MPMVEFTTASAVKIILDFLYISFLHYGGFCYKKEIQYKQCFVMNSICGPYFAVFCGVKVIGNAGLRYFC